MPASTGENELGVWVTAPATLMSEETYFLILGKILQPEKKKFSVKISVNANTFIENKIICIEYNCSCKLKSTYNCF